MRELTRLERLIAGIATRDPVQVHDLGRAQAAVALLLVANPDRVLLIRRAERKGDPWSGHLALPGGRRGLVDHDLLATAIRETREETGLELQRAWQIATLDDLAPTTSVLPPILVRPFVFFLETEQAPVLSDEVAQVGWVELDYLLRPGIFRSATISVHDTDRVVEGYHLPEGFLWGMTERIITPVLRQWQELSRGPN